MLGILAFAMGISVGSFLNVATDRWPAGRSIVKPGSFCESCDRPLGLIDLVPVLSYLWLRGKCRHCGSAIPVRLVVVEAATGLLFVLVYLRSGLGIEFAILSVAVSFLLLVALIDLERGLILNRIVFPSLGALLVLAPFWSDLGLTRPFLGSHTMLASLINSLVAGIGSFLAFLAITLAYPQGMGAGDVKLAAVIGLLVGFPQLLVALWTAFVSGGLVALFLLVLRKKGRKDAIPFGPFLSLGAAAALLAGDELISFAETVSRKLGDVLT